jgi:hypothetical protein
MGKKEVASLYLALGWVYSDLHKLVLSTDISIAQCRDSRLSPAAFLLLKGSKSRGRLVDVETNNSDSLTICEIRSK